MPLVTFMVIGCLEPKPTAADSAAEVAASWAASYSVYPWVYTLKIVLTTVVLAWAWPALSSLPRRVSVLSVVVGVVGVFLWVGLWKLNLEKRMLEPLGLGWALDFGVRSAYNPLEELAGRPALAYGFLAVRLFGLVVVIARQPKSCFCAAF